MSRYIRLINSVFFIFIFTLTYSFSLASSASQYPTPVRSKSLPPMTTDLSHRQSWLINFNLSPNNKEIYALDSEKQILTIVDITTGETLKIIPLSLLGKFDVANNIIFSHDGKKSYFSTGSKNIYILDTNKKEIIGKVANKPESPAYAENGLDISPDGRYLYSVDGREERESGKIPQLHVIDAQTDTVIATIKKQHINSVNFGWLESRLAFDKNSNLLYFTAMFPEGTISILNTIDYTLEDEAIEYDETLIGVVLNSENKKLYALSTGGTVYVTDLLTRKIIDKISSLGKETNGIALVPNGEKIYVSDRESNVVTVIGATQQLKLIKKIPVGHHPQMLHISSDGSQLYVGNSGSNSISVIDIATDTVVRVIAINN